jgi:polysaccharide deacetylase 2 family uncharacterized protein YibQ
MAQKSKAKTRLAFIALFLAAAALIAALAIYLPIARAPVAPPPPRGGEVLPVPQTPAPQAPATQENPPVHKQAGPAQGAGAPPAARPERPRGGGTLAVIIDDAGYSLSDLRPFLEFPQPLTIAVLPNLPHSRETAEKVLAAGKGLLLHCPMEPISPNEDPGPGALRTGQSEEEVDRLLTSAFATVPGAEGLNNHMGSKATADERLMSEVFSFLKREGKYFVDSRTTPDSVAQDVAARFGVPCLRRDGFIDNERDPDDLRKTIEAGVSVARSRGSAILIGHIHTPDILAILNQSIPGTDTRLVSLSELLPGGKGSKE